MYDKLIEKLRDDSMLENCEFDFVHKYMHEAADAIEKLWKLFQSAEKDNAKLTEWYVEKCNKHKWIPVTERLPERNYNCLVADDGTIVYGYMNFIGEWMDCFGDKLKYVSHWMPLPQPPRK